MPREKSRPGFQDGIFLFRRPASAYNPGSFAALSALRPFILLLSLFLSCLAGSASAWWEDAWFDPAFLEAHSLSGGSGFIFVPAPEVLNKGLTASDLHRYRAKLSHDFFNLLELGGSVELEGWK